MRKFIILAISLVALAAVIASPFANAATVDASGVVTVSKGEIQSRMGWDNGEWVENTNSHAEVALLAEKVTATVGNGAAPVAQGYWALNGQMGELVSSTYTGEWSPNVDLSTLAYDITPGPGGGVVVTPIYTTGSNPKFNGFKLSSDGYVYWTAHTKFVWLHDATQSWTRHDLIKWPASGGITGVEVNGQPVTVTPAV